MTTDFIPTGPVDESPRSVFEDYTVTGVSPLRIQRDGDSEPLPFTPDTMVTGLVVDDRVRVENAGGRLIIHGAANGGDTGWQTLTLEAGYTATQVVQARLIGPLVYLRGVITPATDWGTAGSGFTVVASNGLPASMRPASTWNATQAGVASTGVPVPFRVGIAADGAIVIACGVSSSNAAVALGGVSWPVG